MKDNEIENFLIFYLSIVNRILEMTKLINKKTSSDEDCEKDIDHRQRYINLAQKVKDSIIPNLNDQLLNKENTINLAKKIKEILSEINSIDINTLEKLSQLKQNTKNEIGKASDNKNKHRGYNLNNLRV